MSDTTQQIKDRLELVGFLKEYLKVLPAGKNFKAACPFHKEKTPSLIISPDRGIWHCFGCGVGGDVIKFLMLYENLEFYDALKILAEKAGIELKSISNRDFHSHNNYYKAVEAAKEFYKKQLAAFPEQKKYFLDRGLKEETIQEFELGFAPAVSDGLLRHLLKLGFNVLDLEKAGLALKTERGTYWDRFRSRLMFPLYNHFGKTVGFTGRVLPGQENENFGKYVNSPETPIFQKSKFLYGFHKTKNDVRLANSAVVVEGQMDFLMAWQDGVKNLAATSGTALTQDHLAVLRRLSDVLILSFDGDGAGMAAAERVIDLAGSLDFHAKVVLLNGFKDPADLVKNSPGKFLELVNSALPAMQYFFYKYLNSLKSDQLVEKKRAIRAVLGKIKVLDSAVEKSHWLHEMSGLAGIDENVLMAEMEKLDIGAVPASIPQNEIAAETVSRKDLICQRILGLATAREDLRELIKPNLIFLPELYQGIFTQLAGSKTSPLAEGVSEDAAVMINLRASFENQRLSDEKKVLSEFNDLLRQLKSENFKEQKQKLAEAVRKAESAGDEAELTKALKDYNMVCQELQNLS